MSYFNRIETTDYTSFLTTRLRNSELWFINNNNLTAHILGYLARYRERYGVKLFAFGLQGNHHHMAADFPELNRGNFMRDFNSSTARVIPRFAPKFPGGRPYECRYSQEFMPLAKDVIDHFFYIVLQPVKDGLVDRIEKFPGYNCFEDAIYGRERKYPVVDWSSYNAKKKRYPHKDIDIADFTEWVTLTYERLPGYEETPTEEYVTLMREKLEEYRLLFIKQREEKGKKGFVGADRLKKQKPGARPITTKKRTRDGVRARTLSGCKDARKSCDDWQWALRESYRKASLLYRAGDTSVEFPPGMYKPQCKPKEGAPADF